MDCFTYATFSATGSRLLSHRYCLLTHRVFEPLCRHTLRAFKGGMDLPAQLSMMYAVVNMPPAPPSPPAPKQSSSPAQQPGAGPADTTTAPGDDGRQAAESGTSAEALDFDVDELLMWSQAELGT